ncbi:MAG: Asp23/Gls24 family envelope stress response protein [Actinobacteria bacterium]|nr:Asp23/Gls24 family envelope stress response protein [Actinomycetota bacterium]
MSPVLARDGGGSVTVTAGALAQIVSTAVAEVPGARLRRPRRRPALTVADGHARAELELAVEYGRVLPEVARAVQERVAAALAAMCGVVVDAVDVSVEELVR